MLSSPQQNWDMNLVTKHIVTDILSLEIQSLEELPTPVQFAGRTISFDGYVELEWGIENSRRTHRTHFWVASLEDAPFDVVLGRRLAVEYGLADS